MELRDIVSVYLEAFPAHRRRPTEDLRRMINDGTYKTYTNSDAFGLVLELEGFSLLNYFAVRSGMRKTGVGSELYRTIVKNHDPILMEVRRGLQFYFKHGARLIRWYYKPPHYTDTAPYSMMLVYHGSKPLPSNYIEVIRRVYSGLV